MKKIQIFDKYAVVLIIRGTGYKFFKITNDFGLGFSYKNYINFDVFDEIFNEENIDDSIDLWEKLVNYDFIYSSYLIARVGHSIDLCQPIPEGIKIKSSRKDRKLVISGNNFLNVKKFADFLYNYRPPNVYTGRGIRFKWMRVIRKAGKQDKQKGKRF